MRLTLTLLGYELDLSIGTSTPDEDVSCSLDGGYTTAYPVGFNAWPIPEEVSCPVHCPVWDEPDE